MLRRKGEKLNTNCDADFVSLETIMKDDKYKAWRMGEGKEWVKEQLTKLLEERIKFISKHNNIKKDDDNSKKL